MVYSVLEAGWQSFNCWFVLDSPNFIQRILVYVGGHVLGLVGQLESILDGMLMESSLVETLQFAVELIAVDQQQ